MAFHFIEMKITKVKENYLFRRAYNRAASFVGPYTVVYIMKNRNSGIRLGITTGKKIGKAVCRNRARRVITAAFRECLSELSGNYDIIIVARPKILTVKSNCVTQSLQKLFKNAGILVEQKNG